MNSYTLEPSVVQSCVNEISGRNINSLFAGYLGVKRSYADKGIDSSTVDSADDGVQFGYKDYFDRYYRLDGEDDSHFVPFTEKNGAIEKNLWLKHAPGTYTPSSVPVNFEKVVETSGKRSKARYKLKEDHWKIVHDDYCNGEPIAVDAVVGFLYRDFALELEDGEDPSVELLLEAFREEFGYDEDGEEYTLLYEENALGIDKESFQEQ